jgi:hypothetical protein
MSTSQKHFAEDQGPTQQNGQRKSGGKTGGQSFRGDEKPNAPATSDGEFSDEKRKRDAHLFESGDEDLDFDSINRKTNIVPPKVQLTVGFRLFTQGNAAGFAGDSESA